MGQDEGPRQQAGAGADGGDDAKPLGISFCGGRWVTSGEGQPSVQLASGPPLQQVPEFGAGVPPNPFLERADTMDAFSKSAVLDRTPSTPSMSRLQGMASGDKERNPSVWRMSGIAVGDLFQITTDPKVQRRVMKADSNNDGRISRKDILKVMQNEATAKQKLKWGLIAGSVLLAFCLLMLAANAALTYAVVAMSKDTSVQAGGVMTARASGEVVGTAQAAELADILHAYLTPADQASALLNLKSLLVLTNSSVSAYQVLSAHLVPGQRLELVVAAPAGADAAAGGAAVEMARIVIDKEGVHEVRGSSGAEQAGGSRRLLAAGGSAAAGGRVMGQLVASAQAAATPTSLGCTPGPLCGCDGKLYSNTCAAAAAGTSVRCFNCASGNPAKCPAATNGGRPNGLPPNLGWDGDGYVRSPSSPPTRGPAGNLGAMKSKPPPPPARVRRPQRN